MPLHLTDIAIQHLKPEAKQRIVWDSITTGFGVRVSPQGTKSFVAQYGTDRKTETIGRYPDLSLKDARNEAKRLIQARQLQNTGVAPTHFKTALIAFYTAMSARIKKSTLEQYKSYLDAWEKPEKLGEITKDDVTLFLARWQGKMWSQNYAYASLRSFLNWCLEMEYLDKHPLLRSKPPNKTHSRERVLSDEELGRIWRCTGDDTYSRILRLLILTGQRRIEVGQLKPEDVKDGTVTFHTKGDRTNILPITPMMEEELKHLPFKFSNWSTAKERFDGDCGVEFRNHDCRRTLATKMAALQIPIVVIERILGHSFGGKVYQTYQRHTFLEEAKQALLTYHSHILKIASA